MFSVMMRGVTKKFGLFCANDHVDFSLGKGEIHALLGENGAGKTTLMNILYGIYGSDEGSILVNEQPAEIHSPRDAIALGIGMVHQHFMLVSNFTVAQNMLLGIKDRFWSNITQVEEELTTLSEKYKLAVDPRAKISSLSVGEQERVEIVKALYRKAEILILDEPTAVLTPQETEDLFVSLRNLAQDGISIIIITHKLEEVIAVTDRVTVLRRGKLVGTVDTAGITQSQLARMMVGHEVLLNIRRQKTEIGEVILDVKNLHCTAGGVQKLNGISLRVRAGEVLGIAGVDGNGQRELARAIVGLLSTQDGEIWINGKNCTGRTVHEILKQGVAYIPEDRIKDGLLGEFSIEDNLILQTMEAFTHAGIFSRKKIHSNAERLMKQYDVRADSPTQPIKLLSGGNQQKVIFARELERKPKLLIATQPTRGLDIGAVEYMWTCIEKVKSQGVAVLLISTELEEILTLSDRVQVIYEGAIIGGSERNDINEIGLLMAGVRTARQEDDYAEG